MRKDRIKTFYTDNQVCVENIGERSYSKSPMKPKLLLEHLIDNGFGDAIEITEDFKPFNQKDFRIAHHRRYVRDFFKGRDTSNGIPWSKELAESVRYTNSSLYNAIKYACENPETMTFSPTSGFHHASPARGSGFCTFSGQVIASTKLYREKGLVGAYLDLDGHFGNSIEDSKDFVEDLNESVYMNINPRGAYTEYMVDFVEKLDLLVDAIEDGLVDYVVWCHGADSHEWDDLGHQCTTSEWVSCSQIFYLTMKKLEERIGRHIPITLSLFGGYRNDAYDDMLSLHATDIKEGCRILLGKNISYKTQVNRRVKPGKLITV